MEILTFNTIIEDGRYKNKTIGEVFNKKPDFIWKTIKRWAANGVKDKTFSEDVLEAAHITHNIRDRHVYQEDFYVERDADVLRKRVKLKKENKTIDEIINEIDKENEISFNENQYNECKPLLDKPINEDDDFVPPIEEIGDDEYIISREEEELIEHLFSNE